MTDKNNWCSSFKQLLVRLSLYDESLWKTNCYDLNEIKSKLFKLMETTWLIDMHNKPKLRGYITFKTTLIVSSHGKQYISKPRRNLLIQLITGISPIALETGRYKRIRDPVTKTFRSLRVEERLCDNYVWPFWNRRWNSFCIYMFPLYDNAFSNCDWKQSQFFLELNNADKFSFLVIHFWKRLQNLWRLHGKRENRNYSDYELLHSYGITAATRFSYFKVYFENVMPRLSSKN